MWWHLEITLLGVTNASLHNVLLKEPVFLESWSSNIRLSTSLEDIVIRGKRQSLCRWW